MVGTGLAWNKIKTGARWFFFIGLISFFISAIFIVVLAVLELNKLAAVPAGNPPMWFARWLMFSISSMLIGGIVWLTCNWKSVSKEFKWLHGN